jgi:CheY-like chemotaxis protein
MAIERARVRHKHILLADDEPGVRGAIRMLLGVDEHTVVEAADGPEALDLFTHDRFDLVITDYEMPRLKGNEVAVRIKRLSPSQPIIMITAYIEKLGDAQNPVDVILPKPFSFSDLRQAIAQLLS